MKNIKAVIIGVVAASAATPLFLLADVANVFQDGDVIYADDVNANFGGLDDRISTYEDAITVNAGKVGIAQSNPAVALDIIGAGHYTDPDASTYFFIEGGSLDHMPANSRQIGAYGSGSLQPLAIEAKTLILNSRDDIGAGNVGIGTNSPATTLHVAGTITEDSDARLKTDVFPIDGALDRLMEIDGVTFTWIDARRGEGPHMGVIAQEVEAQFPELVYTSTDGYKSVNYSGLVAPMIEAIQEQQGIIDAQRTEIDDLNARVSELEDLRAQLAELRQAVAAQAR